MEAQLLTLYKAEATGRKGDRLPVLTDFRDVTRASFAAVQGVDCATAVCRFIRHPTQIRSPHLCVPRASVTTRRQRPSKQSAGLQTVSKRPKSPDQLSAAFSLQVARQFQLELEWASPNLKEWLGAKLSLEAPLGGHQRCRALSERRDSDRCH
jgi:hypothetical protein